MGSTELTANLLRATQTDEKLRCKHVSGKDKANRIHYVENDSALVIRKWLICGFQRHRAFDIDTFKHLSEGDSRNIREACFCLERLDCCDVATIIKCSLSNDMNTVVLAINIFPNQANVPIRSHI